MRVLLLLVFVCLMGGCSLDVSVSHLSRVVAEQPDLTPFEKSRFEYSGQSFLSTNEAFLFPQPDGTLFTVLNSLGRIVLQKFKADGSPDTSFNQGKFDKDLGGVNIQLTQVIKDGPNALLYVASYRDENADTFLTSGRILLSGGLDPDHTPTNILMLDVFGGLFIVKDNQNDRYFVVNGTEDGNGVDYVRVFAFQSNGAVDTTFGTQGVIEVHYQDPSDAFSDTFGVIIQQDGKILIYGETNLNGFSSMYMVRLNNSGTLDTSFNSTGIVKTQIDGIQLRWVAAAVQQSSGKIILVGQGNSGAAVYRMNLNATRDTSFGISSTFAASESTAGQLKSVALASDEKILVSGCYFAPGAECTLRVTRLSSDGVADASFGGSGSIADSDYLSKNSRTVGSQVVLDSNGRVCTSSHSNEFAPSISYVSCFLIDGSKDSSFGEAGNIVAAARGIGVNPIVIQKSLNSENLLIGGDVYVGSKTGIRMGWMIEKKFSNGKTFTSFGIAGSFTNVPAAGVEEKINSFYQNVQGDIYVLGNRKLTGSNPKAPFVAKLSAQGVLDSAFGVAGRADWLTPAFDHYDRQFFSVDASGKVYVLGTVYSGVDVDKVFVYRLNSNGSTDSTFGSSGVLIVDLGSDFEVRGVEVTDDNKILVAGVKAGQFYATRLLLNGSQDTTFGVGGEWLSSQTMIVQPLAVINTSGIWFSGTDGGSMTAYVSKLDKNGQLDTSWNSGTAVFTGLVGMGTMVDELGRVVQILADFPNETQKVVLLDQSGAQVADHPLGAFSMSSLMYSGALLADDSRLFLLGIEEGGNGEAFLDRVLLNQ